MYFGVRKCATHFVALGFFCTIVPLSIITPEVSIPTWALVHLPVIVTLSTAAFTPKGWIYSILYVLFENAMGMVKLWAVITALLDLKRAQEWVVTTKLGSSDKRPGTAALIPSCKIYGGELIFGLFLTSLATVGLMQFTHWGLSSYFLIQGLIFVAFGFNMVDVGGLLGGRVDTEIIKLSGYTSLLTSQDDRKISRQTTVPVISLGKISVADELQSVESCPPELRDPIRKKPSYQRSISPSHSNASSDETVPSVSSSILSESMSVIPPDNRSPSSKLANIYIEGSQAVPRKGYRNQDVTMVNVEVV